jgi:hypothetical protein
MLHLDSRNHQMACFTNASLDKQPNGEMYLTNKRNGDNNTSQQPAKSLADIHKDLLNCLGIAYQYIPQVKSEKDALEHLRAMTQTSQKKFRRSAQFPPFTCPPSLGNTFHDLERDGQASSRSSNTLC